MVYLHLRKARPPSFFPYFNLNTHIYVLIFWRQDSRNPTLPLQYTYLGFGTSSLQNSVKFTEHSNTCASTLACVCVCVYKSFAYTAHMDYHTLLPYTSHRCSSVHQLAPPLKRRNTLHWILPSNHHRVTKTPCMLAKYTPWKIFVFLLIIYIT